MIKNVAIAILFAALVAITIRGVLDRPRAEFLIEPATPSRQ